MGTPLLIQDAATDVVVFLELTAGGAATGLTFSDVTAGIKKEGDTSFAAFTLSGSNFTDIGSGFYMVGLDAADVDTLGSLYLSFQGSGFKTALLVAHVAEAATAPPTPPAPFTPTTTTLFGYVYDASGSPQSSVNVVARVINSPQLLHPSTATIAITSGFLVVTTDSEGFFEIELITGSTVEFIISAANYRRTVLVPNTDSNLFDIP